MPETQTIEITPEIVKADGRNRVAKTGGQAGQAMGVVIVALWLAHQLGWHGDMPAEVAVAFAGLLTTGAAVLTNLGRLRGKT